MKKKIVSSLAIAMVSMSSFANGLLTTTAQNAQYLRFFTQDANISLPSLYANPAGQAFLSNGFHLAASGMTAIQGRTIDTYHPLFNKNKDNKNGVHRYEGEAFVPVVPSIDFSYNQDKWSISGHFGIAAGGGALDFEKGLASLELLTLQSGVTGIANKWANAPYGNTGLTNAQMEVMKYMQGGATMEEAMFKAQQKAKNYAMQNFNHYTQESNIVGSQYYFGLQVGATYKILDNLAVYGGLRGLLVACNYDGILDATINYNDPTSHAPVNSRNLMVLDCEQSSFAVTPILGIHYRPNKHWELAAKYEFKTRIRLENKTKMKAGGGFQDEFQQTLDKTLTQFIDGTKVAEDLPALLTVGAQYKPNDRLTLAGSWHYFFDKVATKYGGKHTEKFVKGNTMEFLAGAEWKVNKWLVASCSWQNTLFDLTDAYMQDLNYNLDSNSLGFGIRIVTGKLLSIDMGYMHSFYKQREVGSITNPNTDPTSSLINARYDRSNDVVGIGLDFSW